MTVSLRFPQDLILETPRLVLRPFQEADVQDLYAYTSEENVLEMAGLKTHRSLLDAYGMLYAFLAYQNTLALVLKESNTVIGSVSLEEMRFNEYAAYRSSSLSFILYKQHWGKGLMPEALQRVIEYAFEDMDLELLNVGHYLDNRQSESVIKKCGFQEVGYSIHHNRLLEKDLETKEYILANPKYFTITEEENNDGKY